MTLVVRVDSGDPTPAYEQVRRQLLDLIEAGVLHDGDRLPPIRQLAGDLGLAVNTAARAYRELEESGVVQSRRGAGTRVRRPDTLGTTASPRRRLDDLARRYVQGARSLGMNDEEIRAAIDRV